MFRLIPVLLSFFLVAQNGQDWQKDLADINQQLKEMTDRQLLLRSRATRHQEQGDRWQFDNETLPDARRVWNQADKERAEANALQPQIDDLTKQKGAILQKHPEVHE